MGEPASPKQLSMWEPLGPLQPMWDAWASASDTIYAQPETHFAAVIGVQLDEIDEASGAAKAALGAYVNEVVDIISVALNWLRWLGLGDQAVADVLRARTARYQDPQAIFAKYRGLLAPKDIK